MKLISIDSSGLTASVAVLSDGAIVSECTVNNKKTHSQTLLPMIEEAVGQSGILLEDIDAIAIAEGPGSFTGLRIGASTAKGLGLVIRKPVIPVSTLAGLAYNLACSNSLICPIMDARRNQVYTAVYAFSDNMMKTVSEPDAVGIDKVIERLQDENEVIFTGDGVAVHAETISQSMGSRAQFAPAHMRLQRAASIAVLAELQYNERKYVTAEEFKPLYLRLSQAERERLSNKE